MSGLLWCCKTRDGESKGGWSAQDLLRGLQRLELALAGMQSGIPRRLIIM